MSFDVLDWLILESGGDDSMALQPYQFNVPGGTLSALSITGAGATVAQTVPGSTTFYRFTLPTGMAYTPTYTGTLTHTVTLLA